MRSTSLLFLLLALGCNVAPRRSEPPTSAAASGLADRLPTLVKEAAADTGWTLTIVAAGRSATTVDGVAWEWSEQTIPLTFITSKPGRPDKPLTTEEGATLMKALRGELRSYLRKQGGEIMDVVDGEAFHERTLTITYRNGKIDGWLKAALAPNSEAAEETGNTLTVVIREVYGRE